MRNQYLSPKPRKEQGQAIPAAVRYLTLHASFQVRRYGDTMTHSETLRQAKELVHSLAKSGGWGDLNEWPTEVVVAALQQKWIKAAAGGPYRNICLTQIGKKI